MLRFMAFAWNVRDVSQAQAAQLLMERLQPKAVPQWHCAVTRPGFRVFYCGARPDGSDVHCMPEAGVIFGDVFKHDATLHSGEPSQAVRFTSLNSARILSSSGRELTQAYWGSYVAMLCDSQADTKWILRSPMGELQCFSASFRSVQIYCSRMEDCVGLRLLPLSINWSFVAAHIALGMPCTSETGIEAVTSVEGGECVEIRDTGSSRSFYWHPCRIATAGAVSDMATAAGELRNIAKACITTRAAVHKGILHRFSGGLDSSIVLAALSSARASRPEVAALHYYYTAGAFGDERRFARAVARYVGSELIERERNPLADLRRVQTIGRTPSPVLDFSEFDAYRPEVQLAAERRATAIFCGEYGDTLFSRAAITPCAADYVASHGVRPGLFKVAMDVARIERMSVWQCLRLAVRNGMSMTPQAYWRECMLDRCTEQKAGVRLMNAEAMLECRRNIDRFIHPWLQSVGATPPGKLWMILGLTANGLYNNPYAQPGDPAIIAPLASQPLVELCLRMPTYFNTADGWDRAMARRAFAPDLPIEIVQRTAKGASNSWAKEVVGRNLEFVREFLLDGVLVKEGLLDRRKLEDTLPGIVAKSAAPGGGRIQEHLCTEAWIRAWSAIEHRAAA